MKKTLLAIALVLSATSSFAQKAQKAKKDMHTFVSELMAKMTLEEKLGQMSQLTVDDWSTGTSVKSAVAEEVEKGRCGSILNIRGVEKIRKYQEIAVKKSRLGIPLLVGMDIIHGYQTIFPIPLALAASWNPEAAELCGQVSAKEGTANGFDWTFSPMVDVALDSRWGRIAEGNGEDPYLSSRMGVAMMRGYQGDGTYKSDANILACLKHYALYGAVEAGRDYNTVDMSRVRMFNQYLPPYEAVVKAGVGSVMSSFNLVDGVPATGNKWLCNDLLRGKWGFDGFLVTDYASIQEMVHHGVGDLQAVSAQALKAGTDMEMVSNGFITTLEKSLREGKVTMEDIDTACRRILEAKFKLGLFDNPYRHCDPKRAKKETYTVENRAAAREVATQTFVLLKNEGNVLPLPKKGKIALIGPLADQAGQMVGCWTAARDISKYISLRAGMEKALEGKAELLYAQGCNFCSDPALQKAAEWDNPANNRGDNAALNAEAMRVAAQADVIVCAMGEASDMSGESSSRVNLELPDTQMDLLKKLVATGKPVVLLNFSGRATVMNWEKQNVAAIMNVWFPGSEAAYAIPDVLFGDKCPSGKLTVSMPQHVGQLPLYYNQLPTGRSVGYDCKEYHKYQGNYMDVRNDPAFPFGFGLSYTTFKYGPMSVSSTELPMDGGKLTAKVTVTNTGSRDGDEVVQLYIHDKQALISRPVMELKGFERIHLNAGESKDVSFDITPDILKYYDGDGNRHLEPGDVDIMIGSSSRSVQTQNIVVK